MFREMGIVLHWWLSLFGIGLIFFPLTKKLFADFFDHGYLFSKVLGILFLSYFTWLLGSLRILPFSQTTIWSVIVLGVIINLIISGKGKIIFNLKVKKINSKLSLRNFKKFYVVLAEELLFLVLLVFWSYVRALQPDIQGLEKFMDFGFINSILRSKYFPPADMWFAGKSINYYYFGHFVTAFLTKLTKIDSAITYNLMLASLFAFCFSLTFSLTGNLIYFLRTKININWKMVVLGGLVSGLLISLGANLHPAFYNFKMSVLKKPYCDGVKTYWYPNATRYIGYCPSVEDKTIHEFPSYSFVVSDLHGHVSDIPFVLFFLALSFNLFVKLREKKEKQNLKFFVYCLPLSLLLAAMYMTNQWDFPIYLLILGLTLIFAFYHHFKKDYKTVANSLRVGGVILIGAILLFLPFQLNFENIAKGIAFVNARSLAYQLLMLWGGFLFFFLTFFIFLFGKKIKFSFRKEALLKWLSNKFGMEAVFKKLEQPNALNLPQVFTSDFFVIILALTAIILIIVPEIIYLKDIYIPSYHRANTMFKLTYQSFILSCLSVGYILVRVLSSFKKGLTKKILIIAYGFLFACLMVYPFYSIKGYYGSLKPSNYKGLYGLRFLQKFSADDYQVVLWFNNNIADQPVVLEAVGDSYTNYERISMATGLPTVEGWLVHEWLWRGSFDEPGLRSGEVQTIYESANLEQTKQLLTKYNVKYVVIGEMEREKYPNINEKKFLQLGKVVFTKGKTTIFELDF